LYSVRLMSTIIHPSTQKEIARARSPREAWEQAQKAARELNSPVIIRCALGAYEDEIVKP